MDGIATRRSVWVPFAVFCMVGYFGTSGVAQSGSNSFTSVFPFETSFVTNGTNPFWILKPGFHVVLEGTKSGNSSKVDITVTNATHTTTDGFTTRIVKELDYVNGQLIETTDDYLAISTRTNSVYYFGELATQFDQNGHITGHSGSWESGINGAHVGMLMPGAVLLGAEVPAGGRSGHCARPIPGHEYGGAGHGAFRNIPALRRAAGHVGSHADRPRGEKSFLPGRRPSPGRRSAPDAVQRGGDGGVSIRERLKSMRAVRSSSVICIPLCEVFMSRPVYSTGPPAL